MLAMPVGLLILHITQRQRGNMAVRKSSNSARQDFMQYLKEEVERLDLESPILATQWFVEEESCIWKDEYGYNQGGERKIVSKYFDTESEAIQFTKDYDPDPGGNFYIRKQNLREYKEKRWGV